jgi:hypothetical protein
MIAAAFMKGVCVMVGVAGFAVTGIGIIGLMGLVYTVLGKIFGEEDEGDD